MYERQLTNLNNKMFKKDTKCCFVCFLQRIDSSMTTPKSVGTLNDCWTFGRTLWPLSLDRLFHKNVSAQIRLGSGSTAAATRTDRKLTKIKIKFKVFSQQPCLIWNRQKIYPTSMFLANKSEVSANKKQNKTFFSYKSHSPQVCDFGSVRKPVREAMLYKFVFAVDRIMLKQQVWSLLRLLVH